MRSFYPEWTGITKPPIPPDTQGGQWLVDLAAAWKEMSIIRWIDAHGDYFYAHNVWQDEASVRMVLTEMETAYSRQHAEYGQHSHGAMLAYFHGAVAIVHRIWSKLWPDCVPRWDLGLPKSAASRSCFAN